MHERSGDRRSGLSYSPERAIGRDEHETREVSAASVWRQRSRPIVIIRPGYVLVTDTVLPGPWT